MQVPVSWRKPADELLRLFRARFEDVMPSRPDAGPAVPKVRVVEGATLIMEVPGHGRAQMRVEDVTEEHVVLALLRGGAVEGFVLSDDETPLVERWTRQVVERRAGQPAS